LVGPRDAVGAPAGTREGGRGRWQPPVGGALPAARLGRDRGARGARPAGGRGSWCAGGAGRALGW